MQQFQDVPGSYAENGIRIYDLDQGNHRPLKTAKIATEDSNVIIDCEKFPGQLFSNAEGHVSSQLTTDQCLRTDCDNLQQKYLSVFYSKLSMAQQELRKLYDQEAG